MTAQIEHLPGRSISDMRFMSDFSDWAIPDPEFIDDFGYLELPQRGISLVVQKSGVITAVQLHSEGQDGYSESFIPLPFDITFQTSRAAARSRLGTPAKTGESCVLPILGEKTPWDLFECENFSMHLEYNADCSAVLMVTLSAQSAA